MANQLADQSGSGTPISRRTLLGLVFAAGVITPLVIGAGAAHADSGTGGGTEEQDYEIPDDIGSIPWW